MIVWLRHVLGWLRSAFCAREDLILENLALVVRRNCIGQQLIPVDTRIDMPSS
jgi:hypothetical protein